MFKTIFIKSKFKILQEQYREDKDQSKSLWLSEAEIEKKDINYIEDHIRSTSHVDGLQLSKDVEIALNELKQNGYNFVSITSISSGAYGAANAAMESRGYVYGYSFTEGVLICAEKA